MPSFDVVSKVDTHELHNAVDQSSREIGTRYDFKGTKAAIELKEDHVLLTGEGEFQLQQILDILYNKISKRGIDLSSLKPGAIEQAGMTARQKVAIRQGIDAETGKKIVKLIKDSKSKVQASIQGDQVRVTGKKRDDLQEVISLLRGSNLELPLQYVNFRD